MGKSGIVKVTVTEAPPVEWYEIQFVVKKPDKSPADGATIDLITKDLPPTKWTITADKNGIAKITVYDICGAIDADVCIASLSKWKWLVVAYIDNSEYGNYVDYTALIPGKSYSITLKKYAKPPEFYIKFEFANEIVSTLFGSLVTEVMKLEMQMQGLKITKVEGEGTKVVIIHFTPPWTEHSPLAIAFSATPAFVIAVTMIVIGILGTLALLKWTFGEAAPLVVGGLGLGLIALGAIFLLGKKRGEGK